MKKNERLIYTNANGDSLEISWYSPYTPTAFADELDNDVTTSKTVQQDGENYISGTLEARALSIDGFFLLDETNTLERRLKKVFNPKFTGKLVYTNGEEQRYLTVSVDHVPQITNKPRRGEFSIDLTAHDPYWREEERTENIAILQAMLHFPVVIPLDTGIVFGARRSTLETPVTNVGDAESGFRVVFRALGSVKNPQIINKETGERIRVIYNMQQGDVIEVVNEPLVKKVLVNGVKAFKHLDRQATTFFPLRVGDNTIVYQADENLVNLDVVIFYSPLYL